MERSFNSARLELARKRRGLNKSELAASSGISARSLTGYLKGERDPLPATLDRFAEVLDFPADFFKGETLPLPSPEGVSFRAKTTMSAAQRDQAIASAALAQALVAWLDSYVALPPSNVPRLRNVDPEMAAEEVRAAWNLGEARVPNVVHLLEANGVRVFSLADEVREVDGYSFWSRETPWVFLNTMKSAERSRMDAAHELGHLVMHAWGGPEPDDGEPEPMDTRQAEAEAARFASAFLMPQKSITAYRGAAASLEDVVKAKRQWRVSAMAFVHRLADLDLITEWHARTLYTEMSQRGWRTNEPDPIPRETSVVLRKVLDGLRERGLTRADIGAALTFPLDELDRLLFGLTVTQLPAGTPVEPGGPVEHDLRLLD